jgi:NAD(P)-dependent dehydrogenase (short-subunit alcohol dehydrogenase family)
VASPFAVYGSLVERPILITGGGSGIGASLVEHFCAQGARVAFLDSNQGASEQVAGSLEGIGRHKPVFACCDLRDIEVTRAAVDRLAGQTGPFRALINNAGDDERHPIGEVTAGYWDDRMAVNLRHQFFCSQMVTGGMIAAGQGSIVNLGSISWRIGGSNLAAYAAAKAGAEGLTRSLARDLGVHGIRVNCIAPGWVLTPKQVSRAEASDPGSLERFLERQCIKEHLRPDSIARMALWLCADDSRLVTAQTFIVDGGVA